MSSKKDYIEYVRNVLGVKSIYNEPVVESDIASAGIQEVTLAVYIQDFNQYTAEEIDLLQKMLAALKISSQEIALIDIADQSIRVNSKMNVFLTDELKLNHQLQPNEIHTYSSRTLLKKPALKKAAWDELQKILRFFQQ